MIFKNLGEEKAMELFNEFLAKGMSKDDAFNEVYSIECNMDNDEEKNNETTNY